MNRQSQQIADSRKSRFRHVAGGAAVGLSIFPLLLAAANHPATAMAVAKFAATCGVLTGLLIWLGKRQVAAGAARRRRSLRRKSTRRVVDAPTCVPAPFADRLAQFVHGGSAPPSRLEDRFESKMPFWSLSELRGWYGPKPAWRIRRILKRIAASVRGAAGR
ncbi:MAG: hypothetical protein AAF961_07990 [Planctomycetota bacterium]